MGRHHCHHHAPNTFNSEHLELGVIATSHESQSVRPSRTNTLKHSFFQVLKYLVESKIFASLAIFFTSSRFGLGSSSNAQAYTRQADARAPLSPGNCASWALTLLLLPPPPVVRGPAMGAGPPAAKTAAIAACSFAYRNAHEQCWTNVSSRLGEKNQGGRCWVPRRPGPPVGDYEEVFQTPIA